MSISIQERIRLAPYSSWQVGGEAEFYAEPKTIDELKEAAKFANSKKLPITILGGGTNVLISDSGIRGLTICLRSFSSIATQEQSGRLVIECLAGTGKSELLKAFLKYKLEPALFLAGLPGDVGGGIAMNAGVGEMIQPREFVELTDWIEVLRVDSMKIERLAAKDLKWSYRHCTGWQPGIIVRIGISWPLEPNAEILNKVRAANLVRAQKQPLDLPSCGSVFVNPDGHKSGQLIEQCGLKGFTVGGAKVSEKHANFIVNFNKATANDIHAVIAHVQNTVAVKTGVNLRTEVVYLGSWT